MVHLTPAIYQFDKLLVLMLNRGYRFVVSWCKQYRFHLLVFPDSAIYCQIIISWPAKQIRNELNMTVKRR